MNNPEYNFVKKCYKKVDAEFLKKGEMFIGDRVALSHELDKVAEELDLAKPPENETPLTDSAHLAFLKGAEWGFKQACKKHKTKQENNEVVQLKASEKAFEEYGQDNTKKIDDLQKHFD